jgi:hypothetical protein
MSEKSMIRPEIYSRCADWLFFVGLVILQCKLWPAPEVEYWWVAACFGVAFVLKNQALDGADF